MPLDSESAYKCVVIYPTANFNSFYLLFDGTTSMNSLKLPIKKFLNMFDIDIIKHQPNNNINKKNRDFPADFSQEEIEIIELVNPYTMTSIERLFSLTNAVKYIVQNDVPGDIVECGVWKGGSMMAVAKTLTKLGDRSRNLYLFDTFSGMTEPSDKDFDFRGNEAAEILRNSNKEDDISFWCCAQLNSVREAMYSTGYEQEKIHFIKGMVEETIPKYAPNNISILRLDTDWYESTKHELIHLFPRLSKNGVIIIDDYGYWKGAKLAVDEYFSQNKIPIFLCRIDDTGRVAIKQ